MRKISLIGSMLLIVSNLTFAGGLLTNTNQHVSFLRMLARGASIDIDGVYFPKRDIRVIIKGLLPHPLFPVFRLLIKKAIGYSPVVLP